MDDVMYQRQHLKTRHGVNILCGGRVTIALESSLVQEYPLYWRYEYALFQTNV
jgi:hypothetical protein